MIIKELGCLQALKEAHDIPKQLFSLFGRKWQTLAEVVANMGLSLR